MTERLYTLAEASVLLGRSSSTLKHQARKGTLRATLVGKTYVVTRREIARYATTHRSERLGLGAYLTIGEETPQ